MHGEPTSSIHKQRANHHVHLTSSSEPLVHRPSIQQHLLSTLTLTSSLTLAIPPYTPPFSSDTCPASTPVVQTYKTIIRTTITTTTLAPRHCPSFSTRIDTPPPWSSCTFNTLTCIRPACLQLSTITQPCITDSCCTRTATDTVYASCPTKCPMGCATSWTVVSSCAGPPSTSTTTLSPPKTTQY